MARIRILIAVAAGSLIATGTVPASTIVGTPRDDVLRGTAKADKLYGRAGNDRLFGLRGNDVLSGGPGADRLVCGPGRDIARADARDRVAKDCEIVRGLPKPPPPPPPVALGTYCGATSQGLPVCFGVATGEGPTERLILSMRLSVQATCDPPAQLDRTFDVRTRATIRDDRTFSAPVFLSVFESTFDGAFDTSGTSAVGSLSVRFVEAEESVRYECDSGVVTWSARTPPPDPAAQPGRFCGLTGQGLDLCFDVAGTPKTVTNLTLLVRTECTPAATFGVSSVIPTMYAIREDGGFSVRRSGRGTTAGGGTFTVRHTMEGAFEPSGISASGTLSAHVTYDAPDGTHYDCDSGTFAWSTERQ